MDLNSIAKYAFTALLVGGGLWKGLEALARVMEAISNAFKLRAEAALELRRLEDQQIRENYYQTLNLIKTQAERIEQLRGEVDDLEKHNAQRENDLRNRLTDLTNELEFLKNDYGGLKLSYKALENEHLALKSEYDALKGSHEELLKINNGLRRRIRKLENHQTEELQGDG